MTREMLTESKVKALPKGKRILYHTGFLASDGPLAIARLMSKLSDEGYVYLTQRRLTDGQYAYFATRSSKR